MSGTGFGAMMEGRDVQVEPLTVAEATLGSLGALYFNDALTRVRRGELVKAQKQLENAGNLLPQLAKAKVVFLQIKVAVLQGDQVSVDRFLETLETSDLKPEERKQLATFRRLVDLVEVFRPVLPLYAVVDRTLRLIRALCLFVFAVLRGLGLAIVYVARQLACGVRKVTVVLYDSLCWVGTSTHSFFSKVSQSLRKKGDSTVEDGTGSGESEVLQTDVESERAVEDAIDSSTTDTVVEERPADGEPEVSGTSETALEPQPSPDLQSEPPLAAGDPLESSEPESDSEPESETTVDRESPATVVELPETDDPAPEDSDTESPPDQSDSETSRNT